MAMHPLDILAPLPITARPKEFGFPRGLEHEFERIDKLAAKTSTIVAGEARFWDGVRWATSKSTATALSAENRRSLRKYVDRLEKMQAKYEAARLVAEGVIKKLTP